jgi:hypothetical protein
MTDPVTERCVASVEILGRSPTPTEDSHRLRPGKPGRSVVHLAEVQSVGEATTHALIVDALADQWRRDGCDRERHDRAADRNCRRIRRRIGALNSDGVTVVHAAPDE